jgi:hypothetical protein
MSGFDPAEFGSRFHEFVTGEVELLGVLAPYLHIISIIIIVLVFIKGNQFRSLFILYFTLQWILLFGYWGVYGAIYWAQTGPAYLAVYGITPVLLGLITWQWLKEIRKPTIDMNFRGTVYWKWWALLIGAWGFWYPAYVWGQGISFQTKDLLFSNYGLMPCPTTMVVLSLMTLNYPRGNRTLFNLLTAYAILIGIGSVASGWLPDIPFILLGFYSLGLITMNRITASHKPIRY